LILILCIIDYVGINQLNALNYIQDDSLARDPKLLSIKHYVIEIMTRIYIHILGTVQKRT
jgi:hypothetical protein